MNILYVKKGIKSCMYYSEIIENLSKIAKHFREINIKDPIKLSEIVNINEKVIIGFEITDTGGNSPIEIINDIKNDVYILLNKEYDALEKKLEWCKRINPKKVFTVCHKYKEFETKTKIKFQRISWSCNEKLFYKKDENYKYDLFFSGIIRKEQTNDWRNKMLNNLHYLGKYNIFFNYGVFEKNKMKKQFKILSTNYYTQKLQQSKIVFVTTGPADLVGTRFFEISATKKAMIICNRMSDEVYNNMFIDKYNCIMFDSIEDMLEKFKYYIEHEDERLKIVNNAYNHFSKQLKWETFILEMKL